MSNTSSRDVTLMHVAIKLYIIQINFWLKLKLGKGRQPFPPLFVRI